jgi:hypothetical protein
MWCTDCGVRTINEPVTYIFCAVCLGQYHDDLGVPVDWNVLFELDNVYLRHGGPAAQ